MKLSMWILADWLWKYNPIIYIKTGEQVLRGVRYVTPDTHMEKQNVYLGRAQNFIGSGGDGVICVHDHDMMLLDTNDIEVVMKEILAAFDFYNKWYDELIEDINSNCSLQQVIDSSQLVLDEPIVCYDSFYKVMAYTSVHEKDFRNKEWNKLITSNNTLLKKMVSFKPGLQKENAFQSAYIANFPEIPNRSIWVNLFNFKKYLGQIIVIESKHKITEGRLHLCTTLAEIIEYWIRYNEEQAEQKIEAAIFSGLLENKHFTKDEVDQQMAMLNWKDSDNKIIAKIFLLNTSPEVIQKLLHSIEHKLPNCYAILHEFSMAIVCNLALISKEELTNGLRAILTEHCCCCGLSFEFTDIMNLRQYYEQADIALKYGSPDAGTINYCDEYIMRYITNLVKTHSRTAIIHPGLAVLRDYDYANKTELYPTLFQYVLNERNLVKTASILDIHRNSLLYRIKKIKELVDVDLEDPIIREYLLFSFQLVEANYTAE